MLNRKTSRFAALLVGMAMASSITAFAGEMPRDTLDADHAVVSTQAVGETGDNLEIQPRAIRRYNFSVTGDGQWHKLSNFGTQSLADNETLICNGQWDMPATRVDFQLRNDDTGIYPTTCYSVRSSDTFKLHNFKGTGTGEGNYSIWARCDRTVSGTLQVQD